VFSTLLSLYDSQNICTAYEFFVSFSSISLCTEEPVVALYGSFASQFVHALDKAREAIY
jgi:hypothetical protein